MRFSDSDLEDPPLGISDNHVRTYMYASRSSFGQYVDLFGKIVDLLNEIEDIFSEIMAFKQNSGPFKTNLWTFYLERGFQHLENPPPGYGPGTPA